MPPENLPRDLCDRLEDEGRKTYGEWTPTHVRQLMREAAAEISRLRDENARHRARQELFLSELTVLREERGERGDELDVTAELRRITHKENDNAMTAPERVWIRHGMDVFTKCVPESDEYVLAEREREENARLRAIIGTVHECVHPGFPIETRTEMAAVIDMVRGVLNAAGGAP